MRSMDKLRTIFEVGYKTVKNERPHNWSQNFRFGDRLNLRFKDNLFEVGFKTVKILEAS